MFTRHYIPKEKVLDEIGSMLKNIPIESTPPESGRLVYHKVSEITGNLDPYRKLKNESTEKALALYPSLKKQVDNSDDRLFAAIKIAIAGNVIDYGAKGIHQYRISGSYCST